MSITNNNKSIISSPLATGGAGYYFENHVQASFVVLMLTGGYIPFFPDQKIDKIKLQGRNDYKTDDVIVFTKFNNQEKKFLGNIKLSIKFTKSDKQLSNVINSAWQDFENTEVFNKDNDKLVLITGPLSAIDTKVILWILSQAKYTENACEFFKRINIKKYSPTGSEKKLEVIKHHLKSANKNQDITDSSLYKFLKSWQILIYDLGKENSVILSLLFSHISQTSTQAVQSIWGRITVLVGNNNQNAGIITQESLPQDLKDLFNKTTHTIPASLSSVSTQNVANYNFYEYENFFAIASLIGSWDENNTNDVAILRTIFGNKYDVWMKNAREVLNKPNNNIISLKNGVWKIMQTKELYNALSNYIFDLNLENFKLIARNVLKEKNPAFELPKDQRWYAGIYGKNLMHSNNLREGIAKSLAILGNTQKPINCSNNEQENIIALSIHEIFSNANWQLWGSLNDVMPILAEASPEEFLSQIEQDLDSDNPQIPKLFLEEGDAIMGRSYLTGLLWGLEALAWDNELLVRVCIILAKLASIDPGGQWGNRPINSIKTILLPWLPKTIANICKRKATIDTICKEYPDIGWNVLISFLPNHMTISSESYKPKWRNTIPNDWGGKTTKKEYWEQINYYTQKLISLAENKIDKLKVLIDNLSNLPKQSFNNLLIKLSSNDILNASKDNRLILWQRLMKIISKHELCPDSNWSLSSEIITNIKNVADKLKPSDLNKLHQHLFSYNYCYPYIKNENYKQRDEKIANIRKNAVKQILTDKGVESVTEFAKVVEFPLILGESLALIRTGNIDNLLFPNFLNKNDNKLSEFISGYVLTSFYKANWQWVDCLTKDNWTIEQKSQFLTYLPFCQETWNRVDSWLENQEKLYWLNVNFNPYYKTKNLNYAIEKLLQYKRPKAAISCLGAMNHKKEDINIKLCVQTLLNAISSQEPDYSMDYQDDAVKLIEVLQNSEKISLQDMMAIEWSYLSLLGGYGVRPVIIENQLANNSEFFCEIIQSIYHSKSSSKNKKEPTKDEKRIAENAFKLLDNWKTVPGVDKKGIFNYKNFNNWLSRVKNICTKSDHLEVALNKIGKALINSPKDPNGLWINKTIATALNEENSSEMRNGYSNGIFNSRGVHCVNPTGKPESELSEKYKKQANEVKDAGFYRLARTLREISDDYQQQANRVIDEHKKPDLET